MASDAVLLVTLGGPRSAEEIRPFLASVTRGRPIPPERIEEVVRHYEAVGGASPILALTVRQAEALAAALARLGTPRPVYVGMRNWHPFLSEVLARMAEDGVTRVVAVVLAAFRSEVGLRRTQEAVAEAASALGSQMPVIEPVAPWAGHPLFAKAVAERVREALGALPEGRRAAARLLFTAHSIPAASGDADVYQADFRQAVDAVCASLGVRDRTLAYQSRSGNPREPWLGPDVGEALMDLAGRGAKEVLVIPIGFVSDHVEVLYDLDHEARGVAERLGMGFSRAKTVGDHPAFIGMLAELVGRVLAAG